MVGAADRDWPGDRGEATVKRDQIESIIIAIIYGAHLIAYPNEQGTGLEFARHITDKIMEDFTDL